MDDIVYVPDTFAEYIAKTKGKRSFPWRAVIISTEDKELANNDMVQKLAPPSRLTDISWIKPGKVAWEWWNDWNLYGVDFETGINNRTYKYYIYKVTLCVSKHTATLLSCYHIKDTITQL